MSLDTNRPLMSSSFEQDQFHSYSNSNEYDIDQQNTLAHGPLSSPTPSTPPLVKSQPLPAVIKPIVEKDLSHSYAMELRVPEMGCYGSFMHAVGEIVGQMGLVPCCFCCPNPFSKVDQGTVGLITRFGQFYKAADPGLVKVNPISEKMTKVDVRIQVIEISSQSCMTRDNVNIELSSVIYYHIVSPHRAIYSVSDVYHALIERTKTTLRLVVGSRTLQEIIERREEVASSIQEIIDEVADTWGVHVESILIKDIVMSQELTETLAQAAKSRRLGESKIISAKAEVESAKLMRKAADILESRAAMQIRYLDAMQNMAKQSSSKVIFMPSARSIENMASEASVSSEKNSDPKGKKKGKMMEKVTEKDETEDFIQGLVATEI
ncbi:uncharacterized protein SAPINGB_P002353 [Magnusiomyces paraingens]|uniref:Band 7 domain-containing protein n=1 Tax=Magnusiomyces paraingens TaxID=2606893 RepID=A0A5E8BJB5_9ASCO|nr:uncharacterized protein SAPINGB_P002353 [Saprochaete ingens]VVT49607.1 unnamed protein product [Saprochaete ingens]